MKLPETETVCVEVTSEARAKWQRIANCIFDLLMESTGGPDEAYIILQSLVHHFEENYGMRGEFIMERKQ